MIKGINKPVLLQEDKKDRGEGLQAGGAGLRVKACAESLSRPGVGRPPTAAKRRPPNAAMFFWIMLHGWPFIDRLAAAGGRRWRRLAVFQPAWTRLSSPPFKKFSHGPGNPRRWPAASRWAAPSRPPTGCRPGRARPACRPRRAGTAGSGGRRPDPWSD